MVFSTCQNLSGIFETLRQCLHRNGRIRPIGRLRVTFLIGRLGVNIITNHWSRTNFRPYVHILKFYCIISESSQKLILDHKFVFGFNKLYCYNVYVVYVFFNSQGAATPVSGWCVFDSVFRPLPLFRISRPKMFIMFKFDFLTNGELRFFLWFVWVVS